MTETLRPAPGTHLFLLDDEGVVFDEDKQSLYWLNTAAAALWVLLENMGDAFGTSDALAEAAQNQLGLPADVARHVASEAVKVWRHECLLDGTERQEDEVEPYVPPSALPLPPHGIECWAMVRRVGFSGAVVELRAETESLAQAIAPLFVHLPEISGQPNVLIETHRHDDGFVVRYNGVVERAAMPLDHVAPLAKAYLWRAGTAQGGFILNLHAGVVGDETGCILLPAASGSGKSVLTLALMRAGLDYFSDEVALIQPGSFAVTPFPLMGCIKTPARHLFAGAEALPVHTRLDGKLVSYHLPPGRIAPADIAHPVRMIVFPHYTAGSTGDLQPISRAEALEIMFGQCLDKGPHLTVADMQGLVEGLRDARSFSLRHDDLDTATRNIIAAFRKGGAKPNPA